MTATTLHRAMDAGATARRAIAGVARRSTPLAGRVLAARAPDRALALERYQAIAPGYDLWTLAGEPHRRTAVDHLAPVSGEVILDVGCGTGLNFASIQAGIGPRGRLIGVDPSPEMIALARRRVARRGWRNVLLVQATAEDARIPGPVDAVLLCGVHDVMRSPAALANVLRDLPEGGRIVAAGAKWVPWWQPASVPLNLATWGMNRDCVTTFEGFDRPWSHFAHHVEDLEVEDVALGGGYIAYGTRPRSSSD